MVFQSGVEPAKRHQRNKICDWNEVFYNGDQPQGRKSEIRQHRPGNRRGENIQTKVEQVEHNDDD